MTTNQQQLEIYQPDAQVGELKLWRPPAQVLVEAQQAAAELQRIIANKPKKVVFNNEQYLEFEDWETLAHFYGYCPKVESTEFVSFGDVVHGFKACAILLNEHTGMVVSRAESMCLNDEENWGPRPKYEWKDLLDGEGKKVWDKAKGKYKAERIQIGTVPTPLFQLMSMAQTRACAKVCRNKLAWVAVLAGYRPTPIEELDEAIPPIENGDATIPLPAEIKRKPAEAVSAAVAPATAAAPTAPTPVPPAEPARITPRPPVSPTIRVISEAQARRFYAIRKGTGWDDQETKNYLHETFGTEDVRQIPANRYEEACKWAEAKDI